MEFKEIWGNEEWKGKNFEYDFIKDFLIRVLDEFIKCVIIEFKTFRISMQNFSNQLYTDNSLIKEIISELNTILMHFIQGLWINSLTVKLYWNSFVSHQPNSTLPYIIPNC